MKKIKLNAVAEVVAEANGGTISTELLGVLKKAHAAGLNAEYKCIFEKSRQSQGASHTAARS